MAALLNFDKYRQLLDQLIDEALSIQERLLRKLFTSDQSVLKSISGILDKTQFLTAEDQAYIARFSSWIDEFSKNQPEERKDIARIVTDDDPQDMAN